MVYLYCDVDNGEFEVFDSLQKAKDFYVLNYSNGEEWEEGISHKGKHWHDLEYVTIYEREIK